MRDFQTVESRNQKRIERKRLMRKISLNKKKERHGLTCHFSRTSRFLAFDI